MSEQREPSVDLALAREHGLTDGEYEQILAILGRTPSFSELGIFSVMWAEHCSYKSSKKYLKRLPTEGERVLEGPGENAGVVDIGDGLAVVFKIESHNHPSFIEPVQGAATGVGGILRDVFTMGARPIASLDSLRFGPLDDTKHQYLLRGVVKGVGGYGNSVGVATVGGETTFHECYRGNILVNAFNLGLVETDKIFKAKATGVGNPVIYAGSKTGRDGIHGASLLASAEFDDESEAKRPTVQVGDPFTEKCLIEACLELMSTDHIEGIQDMGAAGLTCSSFEMASAGGTGIELDLDRVPQREEGMTAYELLLSESQERMLMVARAGREAAVCEIFERWGLDAAVVGRVTDDGRMRIRWQGDIVVDIPVDPVAANSPELDRPVREPADLLERQKLDPSSVAPESDPGEALLALLDTPNLGSKRWLYRQYDQLVQGGTVIGPGGDAALVRVRREDGTATRKGIALAVDCNPRWCWLDPYTGTLAAVAEAARNVACTGARPLALTNCLNFGSPERPEIMWEFAEATRGLGMRRAPWARRSCRATSPSTTRPRGARSIPRRPSPSSGCSRIGSVTRWPTSPKPASTSCCSARRARSSAAASGWRCAGVSRRGRRRASISPTNAASRSCWCARLARGTCAVPMMSRTVASPSRSRSAASPAPPSSVPGLPCPMASGPTPSCSANPPAGWS